MSERASAFIEGDVTNVTNVTNVTGLLYNKRIFPLVEVPGILVPDGEINIGIALPEYSDTCKDIESVVSGDKAVVIKLPLGCTDITPVDLNIHLETSEGEIVGFINPSDSCKSSLDQENSDCISKTIVVQNSEQISLHKAVAENVEAALKENLGLVPDNYSNNGFNVLVESNESLDISEILESTKILESSESQQLLNLNNSQAISGFSESIETQESLKSTENFHIKVLVTLKKMGFKALEDYVADPSIKTGLSKENITILNHEELRQEKEKANKRKLGLFSMLTSAILLKVAPKRNS